MLFLSLRIYVEEAQSDDSLHNINITACIQMDSSSASVYPPVEIRYLRVFSHPPHHSNHHGDEDDHSQQSANHNAGYLARTQALCRTERQEVEHFSDFSWITSTLLVVM